MNKTKRYGVENFININGKRVDVYSAKIVYRCEECHAPLNYKGAGLVCSHNPTHRGFIHRTEAARIDAAQAININQLSDFYQIVDGKVVIRNGN
jgi:hypothetical protein